jgi:hypothetical protein
VQKLGGAGPDPRRVNDLPSLADELHLLQARAARGTGRQRVSLAELTRRMGLPASSKSTVHSYMSGRTIPPADMLDKIVIALGATSEEQSGWADAWFRIVGNRRPAPERLERNDGDQSPAERILGRLHEQLRRSNSCSTDVLAVSAQNMDLMHQVDRIAPDHEASVREPLESPGGSGANTAFAIALAGARVSVLGAVGTDAYGRLLRGSLTAGGVDTSFLMTIVGAGHRSGRTLVFTDGDGQRLIYVSPGVNEEFARFARTHTADLDLMR